MTARRLTFQLTPLLDLLLIVLFAQFMEVRDTTENQEQTSSAQVENLESDRDNTAAQLRKLRAEFEQLSKLVVAKDEQLAAAEAEAQKRLTELFAVHQKLNQTASERQAIASLYSKLFDLPDEIVEQLLSQDDRRLTPDEIRKLQEQFKELAAKQPGESARHLLTVDEMWKRCDVWNVYIKPSGLTVVKTGDRMHQFEAATPQAFSDEVYDFYRKVPPQKSLVILLLSYGNIDANIYEAAIDGLPKAAERMRSASGGKSRFESAVLGFNPSPPGENASR